MPDENTTPDPRAESHAEDCILRWLLDSEQQRPWSVDEVAREYGDRLVAIDALANLNGVGLIHRMGDFVFATRAAIRFNQIDG
jgi:hypothetical protein